MTPEDYTAIKELHRDTNGKTAKEVWKQTQRYIA